MKTSFKTLLVLAAFGTFATTSCTDNQQEKAGNTANNAGNAVENATDSVKADMAREPGDTAVVVDKPANGVVEETPATPQK